MRGSNTPRTISNTCSAFEIDNIILNSGGWQTASPGLEVPETGIYKIRYFVYVSYASGFDPSLSVTVTSNLTLNDLITIIPGSTVVTVIPISTSLYRMPNEVTLITSLNATDII